MARTTTLTTLPDAEAPLSRREVWRRFLLYPGHTLPTAAAPIIAAGGLAAHDGVFALGPLLGAFGSSWLVHLAGVLSDNFVLLTKYSDIPEHPELQRALKSGALSLRALRVAIVVCLIAAAGLGPYLASLVGWPTVFGLSALGLLASIGYAAGPLPYNRLGITDTVFFAMFAFIAVPATYAVQAAAGVTEIASGWFGVWRLVPPEAFVVGIPIGALVTNVLLIDEIRDVDFDRRKGWRTGAVVLGRQSARGEIVFFTAVAYVTPMLFWLLFGLGPFALLPLVSLPFAARLVADVMRPDHYERLVPMTPRASRLALVYSLLLAIGLAAGRSA